MINSAILVATLMATATDETVNIAAWIEADALVVGQEYELILELELGPGRSSGSAGIPAPFLQIDVPDSVKLSGKYVTSYRDLSKNEFLNEPYERLLRKVPAKIGFTLTSEPAADETIGLSVTGYASYKEDGEVRTFFYRKRLELPVKAGADAALGDPTDSTWGANEELLDIGDDATPFVLARADGSEFDMASVLGKKNIIVTTYRAFW